MSCRKTIRLLRLSALPGSPELLQPWMLGSSAQSGIWAAELGLPYMFADFIHAAGEPVAARYRRDFVPSSRFPAPRQGVALQVICATPMKRQGCWRPATACV